jgi:hypothetical protein
LRRFTSSTALATDFATFLDQNLGTMYWVWGWLGKHSLRLPELHEQSLGCDLDEAASSKPRKIPGNAKTLLI